MNTYPVTPKNKVKRVPKRAHYDEKTVFEILDAGFVCHVSFVIEGQPFLIPTAYGRKGNKVYIHGATTSRMLVALEEGIPMALAVTHVDGIVVARSAFHSSMNYRSAIIYGKAKLVPDEEKNDALMVITENIIKDRWEEARAPFDNELKGTAVLAVEIETASAKIRTGGPNDEKADYELPIWAGVIPLNVVTGQPEPDDLLDKNIPIPKSVLTYTY